MTGLVLAATATTKLAMTGLVLASAATTKLSTVVTADLMQGVFDEIIALLPVCIPVMVGFIGLRKGISFVQSILYSA